MAPERRFAVIVLANRSGSGMPKLTDAISDAMLGLPPKSQMEAETHPLDAAELRRYAGVYRNGAGRIELEADGAAWKATADGVVSRFARGGNGFLLGEANGHGEPVKLVLAPAANGRIEFHFPQRPGIPPYRLIRSMTLRAASERDLPFLVQSERQFLGLNLVGVDDHPTHETRMHDPDCQYWIAEEQGAAAGHVILRGIRSPHRSVELMRIVIGEPGRGLGRSLLVAILGKVFNELAAHRLWLDVYEHNARARHVYRLVGFIEEAVLRECVKQGDRYASLVVMSILEPEYRARG